MLYMGSKRRIAKDILPIMLDGHTGTWVEPFVGGGNMIDKVPGDRIGSDINPWVIDALKTIRDHADELPRSNLEFTEEDYKALRVSDSYRFKGFAGFAYSYGGKWLGGWARSGTTRGRKPEDRVMYGYSSARRQQPCLQGVRLQRCGYQDLKIPSCSTIYCDPPYRDTTGYRDGLDYEHFYGWLRTMRTLGHRVFMSEYQAPEDFKLVWSQEVFSDLTGGNGSRKKIECLYTL